MFGESVTEADFDFREKGLNWCIHLIDGLNNLQLIIYISNTHSICMYALNMHIIVQC